MHSKPSANEPLKNDVKTYDNRVQVKATHDKPDLLSKVDGKILSVEFVSNGGKMQTSELLIRISF